MLRPLLALVAPPTCLACAAPAPPGAPLCRSCRSVMASICDPRVARCPRCALPAPCGSPCPAARAAFDRAWAAAPYDGPAKGLVLALKARGHRAAAAAMAAPIVARAPSGLLGAALVPVPADPVRRRRRGFDHAELIAREVARRSGLTLTRCLRCAPRASHQTGAGRSQRLEPGRLPFLVVRRPPPAVVLIDDVHTTGATLDACARALKAAGTRTVTAVTFARTSGSHHR